MKCYEKLDEETRTLIFDEYWQLGSRDRRVQFVTGLIDVEETKVSRKRKPDSEKKRDVTFVYHLNINGQRNKVCKSCFINTLDESSKFIQTAVANKLQSTSGTTSQDKRGKKTLRKINSLKKQLTLSSSISNHFRLMRATILGELMTSNTCHHRT